MARPKKLKEEGFFHIMFGTVGQEFYHGDLRKVNEKKYDYKRN